MKRILSVTLMLCLLVTTLLISGCLPPNYTKEKAKEIVKTHQKEALAWFTNNMPDAKPDSDCEAYESGTNLLGALKGSYKRNGKNYKYVYEYTNKKMYIGEGYEETCKLVEKAVLKDFGYNKQEAEINFHGYSFLGKNENDAPRPQFKDDNIKIKEFYSSQEKLRPADMTPAQFAQAIIEPNSKEKFDFYLHLYRDDFPVQQLEKQKSYKNLGSIWCTVKIDLTKQPEGIFTKIYLKDKIDERYYHIEKVADDLYAGYISFKGKPVKGDKVKAEYKEGKSLRLIIPEGTKPVIFSNKNLTLLQHFKNGKGETIENVVQEMYKSTKDGIKGYHQYGTELFVKDNISHGYTHMSISLIKGVYDYKILGFFDLDYWRLKFFD